MIRRRADVAVGQAADVCQVLAAAPRRARVIAGERHAESNVRDVWAQAGILAGNRDPCISERIPAVFPPQCLVHVMLPMHVGPLHSPFPEEVLEQIQLGL